MQEWEDSGAWLDLWRKFLGELDEEGILSWDKKFSNGTFSPAQKRGTDIGNTTRGKGTKLMVVADGRGVPLGVRIAPASPAEVTLIESKLGSEIPQTRCSVLAQVQDVLGIPESHLPDDFPFTVLKPPLITRSDIRDRRCRTHISENAETPPLDGLLPQFDGKNKP